MWGIVAVSLVVGALIGALVTYLVATRRYTALQAKAETTVAMLRQQNDAEARLRTEQFERQLEDARGQFREQLNVVREQFQNLAANVIDKTSERLLTENR